MNKKTMINCIYCNGTGKITLENQSQVFGYKVAMARQRLGLTQEQVAQKYGSTRTSITNIESGRQSPPIDRIYELAAILQVEVRDLV